MRTSAKSQLQETVAPPEKEAAIPWEEIRQAITGVRFGSVQLIIQDSRVIQIDKTEKTRLAPP